MPHSAEVQLTVSSLVGYKKMAFEVNSFRGSRYDKCQATQLELSVHWPREVQQNKLLENSPCGGDTSSSVLETQHLEDTLTMSSAMQQQQQHRQASVAQEIVEEFQQQPAGIIREVAADTILDATEEQQLLDSFDVIDGTDQQLYAENKDQGRVRLTDANLNVLKPGDVVEISYYKLAHLIVVESVRTEPDTPADYVIVDAIHYGRPNLSTANRIIRETFEMRVNTHKCWLFVFPQAWCYPKETVLSRARSRLNEEEHHPIANNASQFAMWCKTQSATHRRDNLVPIFLSDEHEHHRVKAGDHLNVKCNGSQRLHAEVTDTAALGQTSLLTVLVRQDDMTNYSIPFVHQSEQMINENIFKVLSTPRPVDLETLIERAQLLNHFVYKAKMSSFTVCLLLTDPNHRDRAAWELSVADAAARYANSQNVLGRRVPCRELQSGDIIHWQDLYQVVTDVAVDEASVLVRTVQYSSSAAPASHSGELFELKALLESKEKDTVLCVHNEVTEDCHLYGGGRDKPSYTASKVDDVGQIVEGSVISLRDSRSYQHAVVVKKIAVTERESESESAPERESSKRVSLHVMSYILSPALSMEQFEIVLRQLDIDIDKHDVYVIDYDVAENRKYSTEETLARAMSRQGERQHDLLWNSGRDFARWCSIRHSSNREQCCVPIKSAQDLLEFNRGHIKFSKSPKIYTHDAIMTGCSRFEANNEIVRIQLYENNHAFRTVRLESLKLDDGESIQRVKYSGFEVQEPADLDQLMGCTFLNASDDCKGWTQLAKKYGSRVANGDFCYWLKTAFQGLDDVQMLFGSHLNSIQEKMKLLDKHKVARSHQNETVSIEENVSKTDLRLFDHVILNRKVGGKCTKVHFVLIGWDEDSSTGVGVTYELPTEKRKKGAFQEFKGFLRITGPGQVEKVVHNCELNWDSIHEKFNQCRGAERYNLVVRNCEHFVNFLIYGRFTSLQICDVASTVANTCPSFAVQFLRGVGKFSRLINRALQLFTDVSPSVPDGKTFWAEGVSLIVIVLFSAAEAALLQWRKATTGMSNDELKQRRRTIVASLLASVAGLLTAVGAGISALLPLLGIGLTAMAVGWAAPRAPAAIEALLKP